MIAGVDAYASRRRPAGRELFEALQEEFPTVCFRFPAGSDPTRHAPSKGLRAAEISLESDEWQDRGFDFWKFDEKVDRAASEREAVLALRDFTFREMGEVLTRCQRWIRRTNEASRAPLFDRVLWRYGTMFALDKPLILADYRHAVDTWQWSLRVDPGASLAVQLAALLHDIERLASESDRRVEQHAPDYRAFKEAHARRGAELARALLVEAGAEGRLAETASRLVREHEKPEADDELLLLNDADALSFFSLNSAGYLDYFGEAQTRKKVHYTLARMRPATRVRLHSLRLRPEIAEMLGAELGR